jgi:hypothetical protein
MRNKLADVKVAPEVSEMMAEYQNDFPNQELAERLLSMLLNQQNETGPDSIGLNPDELNRLKSASRRKIHHHGGGKFRGPPGRFKPWEKRAAKRRKKQGG